MWMLSKPSLQPAHGECVISYGKEMGNNGLNHNRSAGIQTQTLKSSKRHPNPYDASDKNKKNKTQQQQPHEIKVARNLL